MIKMKAIIITLLSVAVLWAPAYSSAACTVEYLVENATSNADIIFGQSWTATCDGGLQSITIKTDAPTAGTYTLSIYSGESFDPGYLLTQQSGITLVDGVNTIDIVNPVTITNGQQYTFSIMNEAANAVRLRYDINGGYAGGQVHNSIVFISTLDFWFQVEISTLLTITNAGAGSGTVTSSPAGIDCGATCSARFSEGTTITLTAAPDSGSAFDGFSGGGCLGNGQCTFILDQTYTITATFVPDGDNDGISDVIENGGPNGGDGNSDGTLDSLQANVATFQSITGSYVTLVSEIGTSLSNVVASDNPSSGDAPGGYTFPQGFFGFTVDGLTPGASTTVTLVLHEKDTTLSTYYKYGATSDNHADHWYSFLSNGTTGAEIIHEADQTTIRLSFVDGKRGDDDLSANGEITDVGAPAYKNGSGGGGGGNCFISTIWQ